MSAYATPWVMREVCCITAIWARQYSLPAECDHTAHRLITCHIGVPAILTRVHARYSVYVRHAYACMKMRRAVTSNEAAGCQQTLCGHSLIVYV